MPILTGSASLTRCTVVSAAGPPDFEAAPFVALADGSEVRETIGFVPFERGSDYQVGAKRWAFRVRYDRRRPDPTAVRERLLELLQTEREETGASFVGNRRRKELRHLAEEELLVTAQPVSKIFECVLDDRVLYVGTTANAHLGRILLLLRKAGLLVELKTPWSDHGDPPLESDLLEITDPTQSLHGSRFLKELLEDRELVVEPADGYLKLVTSDARITIHGRVLADLHRYLDQGCELVAGKLTTGKTTLRLDALAFRVSGLGLERSRAGHWTERLDERMEQIEEIWELLDRKYAETRRRSRAPRRVAASAGGRESEGGAQVVDIRRP